MSLEQSIIAMLENGELTNKFSVAEFLECDQRTAQRLLSRLHDFKGVARICGWVRSNGSAIPVYTKADGKKDAPKPPPLSTAERASLRRDRHGEKINAHKRWDRDLQRIKSSPPRFGFWGI